MLKNKKNDPNISYDTTNLEDRKYNNVEKVESLRTVPKNNFINSDYQKNLNAKNKKYVERSSKTKLHTMLMALLFFTFGLDRYYLNKSKSAFIKAAANIIFGFIGAIAMIILVGYFLEVKNTANVTPLPQGMIAFCIVFIYYYALVLLWDLYDIIAIIFGWTKDSKKKQVYYWTTKKMD